MRNNRFSGNGMNKKAVILSTASALIVTLILAVVFFGLGRNVPVKQASAAENNVVSSHDSEKSQGIENQEMRGLWIATTNNINYPSKQGLAENELKSELDSILENAHELGFNSIFFQVRPASDALYKSAIFPSSRYVSGIQGESVSGFDSLRYIIEKAKAYNIDIHAWINPYRVSMNETEMNSLAANNPAKLHPEYTVKYADGKTYYNPALPEVRKLVVDGVKELVTNYPDVAGIHFDDYFYPYPVEGGIFDDAAQYAATSNGMDLGDWRRNNVNMLIKETYNAVKGINPDCVFGVSVFGIWANKGSNTPVEGSDTSGLEAYFSLYCDALSWAKGGYVDYLAPQDYWSFSTSAAPFDNVARWWNANLDGTGVDLYIGHAAYKSADYGKGEMHIQVQFARSLASCKGSIFYGYENIKNNVANVADDIKKAFSYDIEIKEPVSNGKPIKINYPTNNSKMTVSKSYMIGSCDPAYPLYVNGRPVSKTKGGYFVLFEPLSGGINTFTFTQSNGNTLNYTLSTSSGNYNYAEDSSDEFEITSPYPAGTTWIKNGDKLYVSCKAPAGSVVTARLGETEIILDATENGEADSESGSELYEGTFDDFSLIEETDIKLLGNVEFTAFLEDKKIMATGGEVSQKGADAYVYAEIKNDYTHTKVGTGSSFYDDFLPSSKGMRDYIVSASNGYYKLRFGGYVKENAVELTYGKPLLLNTILTTAVEVNSESYINNKANSTDIRFGVTENIPVDVDFRGDKGEMRIIIYNTDTSIIPEFTVPENPLIKSIEGRKGTRENMLMYYVTLKNNDNFYGFGIVYEDGCMIVKLNNPQILADGDKPFLGKRIIVDAGHGGTDKGAPGPSDKPEKVLNAEIAVLLAEKLRNLGAEVIESRQGDSTVDLYARMDQQIAECPDFAISIHHNSISAGSNALKARGFVALYSNNSGISLSKILSATICDELGKMERKPAYQQLAVARNHMFPSTLLEMCFVSNPEEYQWAVDEGNVERSVDAIIKGLTEYYRQQEKYLGY